MEDEKPFDLRDKIALEILNGIIANNGDGNNTYKDIIDYLQWGKIDDAIRAGAEKRFERLIRSCYKAADIVRKVRLSTFE